MILIDTNVLVGLLDPHDQHSSRAREEYRKLGQPRLSVVMPVLTESWFVLEEANLQNKLGSWCVSGTVDITSPLDSTQIAEMFDWFKQYADQSPDFADGYLVTCSGCVKDVQVWTYDEEFWLKWRTLNGKPVRLVGTPWRRK